MNTEDFSKREQNVIGLLLQGKSNKQIALALGVSQSTVEYHLKNIYKKLQVNSRTEAVLQLGKSVGDNTSGELGKSTVEIEGESTDNGGQPISTRRIPMKGLFYIIGGVLFTTALILALVLVNPPKKKDVVLVASIERTPTSVVIQSAETPLPSTASAAATLDTIGTAGAPSIADVAHFVGENYPDGTNVATGTTFTKTGKLQNAGTTTWATGYSFGMTEGSYPLGESQGFPSVINLPRDVMPGDTVEVSANITAPKTDTIYEIHYKLKNSNGQFVSGDGAEIWLKITVGNVQLTSGSAKANNVTITFINVQKNETITNVEVCAQLPDKQDWNFNGVVLTAGNVQNSLSGLMLKNSKDASTYSSSYRCYVIEFPVGVSNYRNLPVSVTISSIRVPAENNLEANCARAKLQLAPLYPVGLTSPAGL